MRTIRPYIICFLLGAVACCLWSFQESPKSTKELDIEIQVRIAVDEKLANQKTLHMKNCRKAALKKAEEMVDSTLMSQAKLTLADTLNKPPKPPKPELLDIKKAKDNTPIKPLFDENAIEEKAIKIDSTEAKRIQQ